MNVTLPKATSASIKIHGAMRSESPVLFAAPGGLAARAGLRTQASIRVKLEHAGRTIDATSDPRTKFSFEEIPGRFVVDKITKSMRSLGGASVGTGLLRVSFEHEAVSATTLIELKKNHRVCAVQFAVPQPHPIMRHTAHLSHIVHLTRVGASVVVVISSRTKLVLVVVSPSANVDTSGTVMVVVVATNGRQPVPCRYKAWPSNTR